MVNDLIAISLLQFDTGILACLVIVQVTVHLCIAIQKMMHLLHISHRVEDNMILTTTNTENYGREEIHKTLVQMADVAVPANESDVLWRHATFEEAVAYLVATAVVLETDSKELFAIVSVFHLTAETVEVDEEDTSRLRLKFPPSPRSGAYPVQMSDVAMSFDGKKIFSGVNLTVERGDKIAFVGRNGEGKSTLVKCIMGQLQNEGKLELGHNVQIGYFAQNQASLLDGELTVFQTIDDVAKGEIRNKIRDLLGAFMFGGEDSTKKVKVLSGGERTRLAILKLLLEPVNLLILDEPTNHLDLKTKDVLKQALLDFDGTLIVVSHDRDFLDGLVSKVYEFGHGRVREHLCGIYEFLESKKMENLQELEKKQ